MRVDTGRATIIRQGVGQGHTGDYTCPPDRIQGSPPFTAPPPPLLYTYDEADFLGAAVVVALCKRSFGIRYFPKKRWVKVAMKLISQNVILYAVLYLNKIDEELLLLPSTTSPRTSIPSLFLL